MPEVQDSAWVVLASEATSKETREASNNKVGFSNSNSSKAMECKLEQTRGQDRSRLSVWRMAFQAQVKWKICLALKSMYSTQDN